MFWRWVSLNSRMVCTLKQERLSKLEKELRAKSKEAPFELGSEEGCVGKTMKIHSNFILCSAFPTDQGSKGPRRGS